jgi:hypothetical protein
VVKIHHKPAGDIGFGVIRVISRVPHGYFCIYHAGQGNESTKDVADSYEVQIVGVAVEADVEFAESVGR